MATMAIKDLIDYLTAHPGSAATDVICSVLSPPPPPVNMPDHHEFDLEEFCDFAMQELASNGAVYSKTGDDGSTKLWYLNDSFEDPVNGETPEE